MVTPVRRFAATSLTAVGVALLVTACTTPAGDQPSRPSPTATTTGVAGSQVVSRAYVVTSLRELRDISAFVVTGVAGRQQGEIVADGPLTGATTTVTELRVSQVLAGRAQGPVVRVRQLGAAGDPQPSGREILRAGQSYLLFLAPDDLVTGSGAMNIVSDGEYRDIGGVYRNVVRDRADAVPAELAPASIGGLRSAN